MAGNPNPQHNPTDGLGVAAYIQLSGTNLKNRANGGLTVATEAVALDTTGLNGQGFGAVAGSSTSFQPNAQYELQLSLGAKTYGGHAYASTCQLSVTLVDVEGATYTKDTTLNTSPVYVSYNDPAVDGDGDTPAWYNPSNGPSGNGLNPNSNYDPSVASVSSSGLITALAVGQAIIEVQFPTFDNSLGDATAGASDTGTPMQHNPQMMIYQQVVVNVVA